MVGCSSLEVINCSIPDNVSNLSLCHCSSLKHIDGSFPETLRNSVYLNGCNSLNELQCQFLAYDASQGRACLSKAELTADLMWLSANRTDEESVEQLNYSGCDLSGLSLAGLNLSSVNFSDSRFDDADLSGCNLSGASLKTHLSRILFWRSVIYLSLIWQTAQSAHRLIELILVVLILAVHHLLVLHLKKHLQT